MNLEAALTLESLALVPAAPPPDLEFRDPVDGVAIVVQRFAGIGSVMCMHKHAYAHSHFIASGRVRVWQDDEWLGDFAAPHMLTIDAGRWHKLMALDEGTVGLCIHNIARGGEIEIQERASIGE